ncbi:putative nonsense-mediated mrna decay [Diplodia seriata]|uniref:Putative nonsense-mediated mrna decay n=1 Tax=Diplodia seriata TaxID=420778 RepID=A0A0G2HHJ0_9PEZI|nr:putative nonsense-mediated mrna decay [Diplodia seriata]
MLDSGRAQQTSSGLQWNLYGKALVQLQAERQSADIRAIRREKIDGFQGDEVCVEILDLTATSNPGFLREDSRVNTALTRARAGLVIILNHRGLSTNSGYQGTLLQRVFGLLKKARKFTSINNDAIKSRFPSMDDIVTRAAPVA